MHKKIKTGGISMARHKTPNLIKNIIIFIMTFFFVVFSCDLGDIFANEYASEVLCARYTGSNISKQNYTRSADTIKSYLTETKDGYMRVQAGMSEAWAVASYYDDKLNLSDRKEIAEELPLWGGFYESDSNYYIVSGQSNSEESSESEVYRITKYDKNWDRIASCSLYGANTQYPFASGSCRITSSGSYMIIRTCHRMFKSAKDNLNHQANVTIQVNMDTMEISDSYTDVSNSSYGYVSHSFNQFVRIVDNKIVSVDHGDAYPRSLVLMLYPTDISSGSFQVKSYYDTVNCVTMLKIPGSIGNNTTGTSVGGFEISDTSYLIAGNSVDLQSDENLSNKTRNVFITSVDKSTNAVSGKYLTDYPEGEETVTTPHLVKINDNKFLMMWSRGEQIFYVFLDGKGDKLSEIESFTGELSDCVPIVSNGNIIWYTWYNEEETFYIIPINNPEDINVKKVSYSHDYEVLNVEEGVASVKCNKCGKETKALVPTSVYASWKDDKGWTWSSPQRAEMGGDSIYIPGVGYENNTEITEKIPDIVVELEDPSVGEVIPNKRKIHWNKAGKHKVILSAKYNPEVKQTYTVTVVKDLEGLELNSAMESPQKYHSKITFTATPDGGRGKLKYQFIVKDSEGTEEIIQDDTKNTCTWIPDDIGTFEVTALVTDPEDNKEAESNSISYTIEKADIEKRYSYNSVCSTTSIVYGQKVSDLELNEITFVESGTTTKVPGKLSWVDEDEVPCAGSYSAKWRFVPEDENYNILTGQHQIVIKKATPVISENPVIGEITYNPAKTLASIAIPDGKESVPGKWTWKDDSIIPSVGEKDYDVIFTPEDSDNYDSYNTKITVKVNKAVPYIAEIKASGIIYGNSLRDSIISAKVQISEIDETVIKGIGSWKNGDIKPEVKDSNVTLYSVVFTPEDSSNYESVESVISLTVSKAALSVVPKSHIEVDNRIEIIDNSILLNYPGWKFKESDIGQNLIAGETKEYEVYYEGEDADNYDNIVTIITVYRDDCSHEETELRNIIEPTCEKEGYIGDTYCKKCNKLIKEGDRIPIADHKYGQWKEYDENTHIRYCEYSKSHFETADHEWGKETVVRAATESSAGIKSYECMICGYIRYVDIPIITMNDPSQPIDNTQKEDRTTQQEQSTTQTKTTEAADTTHKKTETTTSESVDAGEGVGTIIDNGEILIDSSGIRYRMANKLSQEDLKNSLKIADKKTGGKFKITKVTKKGGKVSGGTVTYVAPYNKNCTAATIPNAIKIGGVKFTVTQLGNNAFKNCRKLTKVTIGTNVIKIGSNAFNGCVKLTSVNIKTTKLSKIGAAAFKGTYKNIKVKVPKKQYDKYYKMITKAKLPKTGKITK